MWKLSKDNGKVIGAIFIDFRKAFDPVDHNIPGYELQACGITGRLWDWLLTVLLRHRCTHVPNLIDESTTKERRLNQFGTAVLARCGKGVWCDKSSTESARYKTHPEITTELELSSKLLLKKCCAL